MGNTCASLPRVYLARARAHVGSHAGCRAWTIDLYVRPAATCCDPGPRLLLFVAALVARGVFFLLLLLRIIFHCTLRSREIPVARTRPG